MKDVLTNLVVNILQYLHVSNHHLVHKFDNVMCQLYLNKAEENKYKTYLELPEAYPYQFSNLLFTEKSSQNSFYMTSFRYLINILNYF